MEKIEKNTECIITIEDITSEGEGIGRVNGFALFVKDTIMGDVVKVKIMKMKKSYGYARLIEIISPSPYRVEPVCPVAKQCGGCQLQHCSYEKQLEFKENKIRNCLERIGKLSDINMESIIGMDEPFYYRNKAQFPVGKDKDGKIVMGFYAGRTHSIIDTPHCYIQAKENDIILPVIRAYMEKYHIEPYDEVSHTGLIRHVLTRVGYVTKEIMVCLVINGKDIPHKNQLIEKLSKIEGMTSITLNINQGKTNVILGKELKVIWGHGYITDYIGEIKYQISPLSFYQVNSVQTKKLYETALDYAGLTGEEIVWDLYCGIGTISLFLAQKAKQVYGVEIVPEAIEDAKRNAKINGIENAEFFVGAAEEILPSKYKESNGEMKADVIVIDPPRKGCDEVLLQTIIKMKPKKVVYVSCDPATLARDLRYLVDEGFEVEKVRGCDMFGMTGHVETVCLLSNRKSKPDSYVDLSINMEDYHRIKNEEK